jgi:branched-chain amino acid transport system substrate-binding protein
MVRKPFAAVAVAGLALGVAVAAPAPASAQAKYKIGIVSFLTGPGAPPFGIPARNSAELVADAINKGALPPPYNTKGIGGRQIELVIVDENGPTAEKVTDYRNLVQRDRVDFVIGYISSGNCLAVAPVAEELKKITLFFDCGTPRTFEDASPKYVFRVTPHALMDNVAAARYVVDKLPKLQSYAGLNQNYAWGQDSWRDFAGAMKALMPKAKVARELFPKLFAGEYGSEISAVAISGAGVVHTSHWGGDLESLIFQASARGLTAKVPMVITTGESAIYRLKEKFPDGMIIGGRGAHGIFSHRNALNDWYQPAFRARFKDEPNYPTYHMFQSFLGLKTGVEKAVAANGGKSPTDEQIIKAMEGMEFETASGRIRMALGNGHQGIGETAYGTTRFDKAKGVAGVVDMKRYPAECVNPPPGVKSLDWLAKGMPGAKC